MTPRVHFDEVRVPADNLIGQPGRHGKRIVEGAFSWTAALIGAACVGTMRAAFEYALDFARTETRLGTVPVIEHQNVGFMLADIKMRIEACRYLTWKACHDFEHTHGLAQELAIMTKVYCSETAVSHDLRLHARGRDRQLHPRPRTTGAAHARRDGLPALRRRQPRRATSPAARHVPPTRLRLDARRPRRGATLAAVTPGDPRTDLLGIFPNRASAICPIEGVTGPTRRAQLGVRISQGRVDRGRAGSD